MPELPSQTQDSTARWQALDREHYLHPFTDHRALHQKGTRVITSAEGIYLRDSEGHRILDGMAGLWCVNLGYGRQEIIEAVNRQMQELPYYNSFFQCAHPPVIELASAIADVSPPGLNHVFFTGSGSEANDTIIRMVRHYWALRGEPDRGVIISRRNAYHGSTIGAASLGGMKFMHAQGWLPIPGIEHIEQPYWFDLGGSEAPADFGRRIAGELEKKIRQVGPEKVAAFIGEPVQGAGGVIIAPETYWPEIQDICRRYGILLISDEVITGFGRLGQWFGSQALGFEADLMPFAKGVTSGYLPLGGVIVGEEVADVLINEGGEFAHGYTYSGHPATCAAAMESIRILEEENIVQYVHDVAAPWFREKWLTLADHPLVGEARCVGLMGALELVQDKKARRRFSKDARAGERCRDLCIDYGLVMRAVGDTMIVAPPLVITREQLDELVEKAGQSLDALARVLTE